MSLVQAARYGNINLVKKLLADPNVDVHADGEGALRRAFHNGHRRIVELLLQAGADPTVFDFVLFRNYGIMRGLLKKYLSDKAMLELKMRGLI